MIIAAIVAILAQAATPAPALPPSGKWVIEGENNMCALLHGYGAEKPDVTLGIRPWPIGGGVDILLFTKSIDPDPTGGSAHLTIDAATSMDGYYQSYALAGHNMRLATLGVSGGSADAFVSAKQITVSLDRGRPITVSVPDSKAAFAALANCNTVLLKSLGIDPAWAHNVAVPAEPIGSQRGWFSPDDYPTTALRGGAQGTSSLLITVGVDGRVSHCSNFGSAGNADIDAAACDAIRKRGRYQPARDAQGKPVVSYLTLRTRWQIPQS